MRPKLKHWPDGRHTMMDHLVSVAFGPGLGPGFLLNGGWWASRVAVNNPVMCQVRPGRMQLGAHTLEPSWSLRQSGVNDCGCSSLKSAPGVVQWQACMTKLTKSSGRPQATAPAGRQTFNAF